MAVQGVERDATLTFGMASLVRRPSAEIALQDIFLEKFYGQAINFSFLQGRALWVEFQHLTGS